MNGCKMAQNYLHEALIILLTATKTPQELAQKISMACLSKIVTEDIPFILKSDYIRLVNHLNLLQQSTPQNIHANDLLLLTNEILNFYTNLTGWLAVDDYIYNQNLMLGSHGGKQPTKE